jgi:hypothetical protein
MIRKSGTRFSEKIMLDQKTQLDLEKLEPVSCLREAALAGCLFV